jgi:hypothetical protein
MRTQIDGQDFTVTSVPRFGRLMTRVESDGRMMLIRRRLPDRLYRDLGEPRDASDEQLRLLAELFDRHALAESEAARRLWPVVVTDLEFCGGIDRRFPSQRREYAGGHAVAAPVG